MIYSYEVKDWNKSVKDDYIEIIDDDDPIVDSNFDNFDEREISCLIRVNFQTA